MSNKSAIRSELLQITVLFCTLLTVGVIVWMGTVPSIQERLVGNTVPINSLGGTVAGAEGRHLHAESGATGAYSEEIAREIPSLGPSRRKGSGGADVGDAGSDADL